MIQFSALMWAAAIFFGIIGFLRGWNKELVATAGMLLTTFAIFQFDSFLRGTIFLIMPRDQVFLLEAVAFLIAVYVVYQARDIAGTEARNRGNWQAGFLGALVGGFNGYLIIGTLWYFMDINEYPITQFVIAPSPGSPSAQFLWTIPLVLIGGGTSGTGDLLALLVIALLFFVLIAN